ncbi:MAG: hypothetical protein IT209_03105 [Armatimonadetes bacterium]|nr:hypothetical protein [Armatimonadota bacterium]
MSTVSRAGSQPRLRLALAKALWNWQAHPTQREWLLCDASVKTAACGRRWGKTEAQAVDAASFALVHDGSEQIVVAPTYDQASLIARGVERLLLGSPATRTLTQVRRTPYPLITVGRSRISARTADEDGRALRGHRADRVIVDEAAFVRDSVISEVIQPMLADSDGQLILISTPYGRNLFWKLWSQGASGNPKAAFRFPSSANPHISARYVEEQRERLPERAFRAEYLAEFVDDQAQVFAWTDIQQCFELGRTPHQPSSSVRERRIVAGIDWARYSDWTVCAAVECACDPWRVVALDRFQGLSWQAAVERVAGFLKDTEACAALSDATATGGDALLEQLCVAVAGAGCEVDGYVFTSTSKQHLVENLSVVMARGGLALPPEELSHSGALIHELKSYQYVQRPGGAVSFGAAPGEHDDCVTALALAVWQAKNAPQWRIMTSGALLGDRRRGRALW